MCSHDGRECRRDGGQEAVSVVLSHSQQQILAQRVQLHLISHTNDTIVLNLQIFLDQVTLHVTTTHKCIPHAIGIERGAFPVENVSLPLRNGYLWWFSGEQLAKSGFLYNLKPSAYQGYLIIPQKVSSIDSSLSED